MILQKNTTQILYLFLFSHLILWVLIPSISNINLPLDTIEALAWGSNMDWGFNKHPPVSAFIVNIIYSIFGSNDWAYYLLSQICVILSFIFVWELSKDFFSNRIFSLLSVLILEGIFFFNYTTPEFNVYVCQLPLKAALVYFFWKGINDPKANNWIFAGLLGALGLLTHYSFIFIIFSLLVYFVFFLKKNKKYVKNFFLAFIVFSLIITPHIIWLVDNNYETINYALKRTQMENKIISTYLYNPLIFLFKQIGMLILFLLTFISLLSIKKLKNILYRSNDKKLFFLVCINLLPLVFVFIISLLSGAKIRTMWMSTFYLFFGILFFYYFKNFLDLKKINRFLFIISFIFILSPVTYYYISLSNDQKRTDFPGKEIARLVQKKWDDNFINEIKIVVGDEWYAGNLSYHLINRPRWFITLDNQTAEITDNQGVIYTGNPKILKKICPGVFGTIKPVGYCMIGKR